MKKYRVVQTLKMLAIGAVMLQAGGCDVGGFTNLLQTVFLGITAAGSIAILQNI